MIADSRHSRLAGQAGPPTAAQDSPREDALHISAYRRMLLHADRACCCIASPTVLAVMPTSPTRQHRTELLFCMHHYRASRRGLSEAGALVVGADGHQLGEVRDREHVPPGKSAVWPR